MPVCTSRSVNTLNTLKICRILYLGKYPAYLGVRMTSKGNSINVWDGKGSSGGAGGAGGGGGSSGGKTVTIYDLIGQPTWIAIMKIQFRTVMRTDIIAGDTITLPQTLFTTGEGGAQIGSGGSEQKTGELTFSGSGFIIESLHHVGDFRGRDSANWCTIFNAAVNAPAPPPTGIETAPLPDIPGFPNIPLQGSPPNLGPAISVRRTRYY